MKTPEEIVNGLSETDLKAVFHLAGKKLGHGGATAQDDSGGNNPPPPPPPPTPPGIGG